MPQDPIAIIESIITNAMEKADEYSTSAETMARHIFLTPVGRYFPAPATTHGFVPEAVEPEIPEVSDTIIGYEAQLDKLVKLLSDQLAGFFATYYPLSSDALDEANAWIVNQITNGGHGINEEIEAQLWQRGRDRIIRDGSRVEKQITVGYAARGYTIPPGSMLAKIDEARFAQLTATGEASTTIAAKMFEAEVEAVKFAVESALKARQAAMQAAADYIRAIASAPDSAVKTYNMKDENRARMMSAAATWYGARLERDRIVLQSKLAEMEAGIKLYDENHRYEVDVDRTQVDALGKAADVYASTASAALSSLNSIVSTASNI